MSLLEVKDLSEPVILNNVIRNNEIGINSYKKKEEYGGGHAQVWNTLFYNNIQNISFKNTFYNKLIPYDDSDIQINFSNLYEVYYGENNIFEEVLDNQLWIDGFGDNNIIRQYFPDFKGEAGIGIKWIPDMIQKN